MPNCSSYDPEAQFLDEIQTKSSTVFLLALAIQSHLQLCLEISISSNSRNLLCISTVKLLYTVKEKGGKPDRKPYPLPFVLRNPYRNLKSENSQDYTQKPQRNCTFMNSVSYQAGLTPKPFHCVPIMHASNDASVQQGAIF